MKTHITREDILNMPLNSYMKAAWGKKSSENYFKRADAYEEKCKKIIRRLCKACPHQEDNHLANCTECCPLQRAMEHRSKS